jgi:polysaccharide biosynthesis/export protein
MLINFEKTKKMYSMPIKSALFLVLLLFIQLLSTSTVNAQNDARGRSTGGGDVSSSGAIYFVDEVGTRMVSDGMPLEGYVDAETYILGSMDIITVVIRGAAPATFRGLVVNSEGILIIPTIGSISVKDLTLSTARDLIIDLVRENYRSDNIVVTLEKPKPITVHVSGEVLMPGRSQYPANTRLDGAVIPTIVGYERDGINEMPGQAVQMRRKRFQVTQRPIGSLQEDPAKVEDLSLYDLRNITVRNRNGNELNIDLLSYYLSGNLEGNPYLLDGDAVIVHRRNMNTPRVSVGGAVKYPFEAGYRSDDTLLNIFKIAGGYMDRSDTTFVLISRLTEQGVETIRLTGSVYDNSELSLQPNDRIIIPTKQEPFGNHSVWISGEFNNPGNYAISDGSTTLREILKLSDGPTNRALLRGAYLHRNNVSDFYKTYGLYENTLLRRTSDQVEEGLEYLDHELSVSDKFMFIDLTDESLLDKIKLFDGDRLHIPRDDGMIRVLGQVNKTGFYPLISSGNVQTYLSQAGGLTISANPDRVFVIKAGGLQWHKASETSIESGDIIFVDRNPYDTFEGKRNYELQERQLKNARYQLLFATVGALSSLLLAYAALIR